MPEARVDAESTQHILDKNPLQDCRKAVAKLRFEEVHAIFDMRVGHAQGAKFYILKLPLFLNTPRTLYPRVRLHK